MKRLLSYVHQQFLAATYKLRPPSYWHRYKKLEIGSGPTKRPGWLTLDNCRGADLVWNLNNPLPFPDECFETLYSSHVLEHFTPRNLRFVLAELYRVLKPGGNMLICVPDASKYVEAYITDDDNGLLRYEPAIISSCRMDFLNYIFYMDGNHHMMFDLENLKWHTEQAGFKAFAQRKFDEAIDSGARQYESLYAICSK